MTNLKTDLRGLFNNVKQTMPRKWRDYYGFSLDEVIRHLEATIRGEHTLQEFAEHYGLDQPTGCDDASGSTNA